MTTLPNGDLVVAGSFNSVGGVLAINIARWNGTSWFSFPGGGYWGSGDWFDAVTTMPNGDIVAAGNILVGTAAVDQVFRWNGVTWSILGQMNNRVASLIAMPNGDLIAGGSFTTAGGVSASRIARWNGTTWSSLGSGMNGAVLDLAVMPNGDLVAGGGFALAGGVGANGVARWNGMSWSALSSGMSPGVNALVVLPNGDLVAGGNFTSAGGVAANRVARWDGANWSAYGGGPPSTVRGITRLANGDLIAGGDHPYMGVSATRWSGADWLPLGAGLGQISACASLPNGHVVAGGVFLTTPNGYARRIALWNGSTWSGLGSGVDGPTSSTGVGCLAPVPNGDVVAGGYFTTAGGVAASNIARWDGANWSPLGSGTDGPVSALLRLPNGDIVAAGQFATAGGVTVNGVARGNGCSWLPLGTGMQVGALYGVYALGLLPNGDIVAGGEFTTAGGVPANRVARWNGAAWSAIGSGANNSVGCLCIRPNGDLVIGGSFTAVGGVSANRVASWNGVTWSAMGTGMNNTVYELANLPSGDLVAGGGFATLGTAVNNLARWNGSSWSAVTAGAGVDGAVYGMTMTAGGDLAICGAFWKVNGGWSAYFARLRPTCLATAVPYGSGCSGSGGLNTLAATALPWMGNTFRAQAMGMPATAFVLAVTGFAPISIPMPAIFAQGVPGCSALVYPDFLDLSLPAAGTAQSQVALPATPALIGQSFYHQIVAIEVDLSFAFTAITSTNALTLTIGGF